MRVRISYGLDIKDVPEKAEDIGWDAVLELKEAVLTLTKAIENIEESKNNYNLVIDMLEKVRLKLNKSDLIIEDLQSILQGLQNYHDDGGKNVSERRPIVDPSGDTNEQTENSGEG